MAIDDHAEGLSGLELALLGALELAGGVDGGLGAVELLVAATLAAEPAGDHAEGEAPLRRLLHLPALDAPLHVRPVRRPVVHGPRRRDVHRRLLVVRLPHPDPVRRRRRRSPTASYTASSHLF